jgi:hypothetical protein
VELLLTRNYGPGRSCKVRPVEVNILKDEDGLTGELTLYQNSKVNVAEKRCFSTIA